MAQEYTFVRKVVRLGGCMGVTIPSCIAKRLQNRVVQVTVKVLEDEQPPKQEADT